MKHKITHKTKLHLEKMGKNHVRLLQHVMENIDDAFIDDMCQEFGLENDHVNRLIDDYIQAVDNFWEYA